MKKKRTDAVGGDWMGTDGDIDFEVYGKGAIASASATSKIASYSFEVCDNLLNIGPCGNVSMGEPAFLSEEFAATKRYVLQFGKYISSCADGRELSHMCSPHLQGPPSSQSRGFEVYVLESSHGWLAATLPKLNLGT